MTDSFRNIWKLNESFGLGSGPLRDILKLNGTLDALLLPPNATGVTFGPPGREARELRSISRFLQSQKTFGLNLSFAADIVAHQRLVSDTIGGVDRFGFVRPTAEAKRALSSILDVQRHYSQMFRLPEINETLRLTNDVIRNGAGVATSIALGMPGDSLHRAMDAMRTPWLRALDPVRSALGFAEIQSIGRLFIERMPFDQITGSALRANLGEWRDLFEPSGETLVDAAPRLKLYADRGFNAALTDFTPNAFDESVAIAGFQQLSPVETEIDDDGDVGYERARVAFEEFQRFERALRRFIERTMHATYGDNWAQRQTPVGMFDRWVEKRNVARKAGEAECPLIDYADFTDYKFIIERKDNWSAVFATIFGRPEDVRESFQRLFAVRIATMHARPLTLEDRLLQMVETRRILNAIRRES